MKKIVNAVYNLVEETLSSEELDRLISELETLRDYKIDEDRILKSKERVEEGSREYLEKGYDF